jgi:hypothetical protein
MVRDTPRSSGRREEKVEQFSSTLARRIFLLGTPLTLTVLMIFHPYPYDDIKGELVPIAVWWTVLHTLQFVLFALMGAALWALTDGLRGIAVTLSRIAAAIFVVFYDAGDAIAGISTGILAYAAREGELAQRTAVESIEAIFRDSLKNGLFEIGQVAWIVALATAAVALYRAGAPRAPLVLLVVPAFLMWNFDHAFPFGSLTFGSFFVVACWLEFGWGRPTLAGQPRRVS